MLKELKLIELHHFSDASSSGYNQCSYLRLVSTSNQVHCSFVMGKARVAPLKQVTIPRLELTVSLVSVKVSAYLQQELEYSCTWFDVFVANRVQQIVIIAPPINGSMSTLRTTQQTKLRRV